MSAGGTDQPLGLDATGPLLRGAYRTEGTLCELGAEFRRGDYVKLPQLLRPEVMAVARAALQRVEHAAVARAFQMEGYDTPRRLSTIGGERLGRLAPSLVALYRHRELRDMVAAVTGGPVFDGPNPNEAVVVNLELSVGATHGWHLDDVPYALVVHAEAPPPGGGGELEFIPDWRTVCQGLGALPEVAVEPTVAECRRRGLVRTEGHAGGDAYLLRADTSLHRVTELTAAGARRVVLVFAFETSPTVDRVAAAPNVYGEA